MDIVLETINTLKNKGWYDELKVEFSEAFEHLIQEENDELLNILKSDKVTVTQIKELFMSSINTSNKYKICKLIK